MVPNGWKFLKLGSVAELQRGFDLPSAQRKTGNVPIISSAGATGLHNEFRARKPGVVTGRYGSIGDVFYIEEDYWPLNTTLWVKNFHGNFEKFIYYLLSSFDFSKFSDKTGVPGVNRNDLHTVKVAVPPVNEQKAISQVLSTWDEAIAANEDLLANSRQRKKALMQKLLTGKTRLPGFGGEWKKLKIAHFCSRESIRAGEDHSYPVLSCTKHDGFVDSLSYFDKQVFSDDTSNYKVIKRNWIGFPSNHIEEGSIGIQNLYDGGIVSPIYETFSVNQSKCLPEYLYANLKTDRYRQIFASSTNASVDRRGSLRWDSFSLIEVLLPPIDEQRLIVEILQTSVEEIEALEQRINNLKTQKKALMQQLLTGKKRVAVESAAA